MNENLSIMAKSWPSCVPLSLEIFDNLRPMKEKACNSWVLVLQTGMSKGVIIYIYTNPACRRKGYAKRLIKQLKEGFTELTTQTLTPESEKLLKRCDFKKDVEGNWTWKKTEILKA